MEICLAVAATGLLLARLGSPVTLAWTHTVDHTRVEERYRAGHRAIVLEEVRVAGPVTGIEPPDDAVLGNRGWSFRPPLAPMARVVIAHSAGGYRICSPGHCRPLEELARSGVAVALTACEAPPSF
jgi:hypothetical protein